MAWMACGALSSNSLRPVLASVVTPNTIGTP
jgi:hypothetical protein